MITAQKIDRKTKTMTEVTVVLLDYDVCDIRPYTIHNAEGQPVNASKLFKKVRKGKDMTTEVLVLLGTPEELIARETTKKPTDKHSKTE